MLGTVPNVLDVRPGFPAKTAQELIAYAKANPGKVSFASQGNGSTSHLTGILFQKLTGTQMVHVPYRGTTPALQDIMASQVDLFFDNLGSSLSLQGDKLDFRHRRQQAQSGVAGCSHTSGSWRRFVQSPPHGLRWWRHRIRRRRSCNS